MPENWKRGDIGPDGRRFWKRGPTYRGGLRWVNEEAFQELLIRTSEQGKSYRGTNRGQVLQACKVWRMNNPGKVKADWKDWYAENAIEVRRKRVLRGTVNKEIEKAANRRWRKENPEKVVQQVKRYRERAREQNPDFVVMERLRGRIRTALSRSSKTNCPSRPSRASDKDSVAFLMWLAGREGISKAEMGGYQIDHIYPVCRWMENKSPEEFSSVNSPENVRWLKRLANAEKGGRLPTSDEVARHLAKVAEWRKSFSQPEGL